MAYITNAPVSFANTNGSTDTLNFNAGTATNKVQNFVTTAAGDILYREAGGNNYLTNLAIGAPGTVLTSGSSGLPEWDLSGSGTVTQINTGNGLTGGPITTSGTISLVTPVTIANGGTNSTATLNNNRIIVSSGGSIVEGSALTNGELFIGSTGALPVAAPLTGTTNQVIVTNGAGSITLSLPQSIATTSSPMFASETLTNTSNQLTLGSGSVITITAPTPGGGRTYTIPDTGTTTSSFIMADGAQTINGTKTFTTPIAAGSGGTGLSSYTTGDLLVASSSSTLVSLSDVATGNVLLSGGVGVMPTYGKINITNTITGILPIVNGGTNLSTTPTNGQLLIGNGSGYTLADITGTSNQVIVTNGAGSITLSLPQSIATTSSPTFSSETLTNTSNQLTLGSTNTTTISATAPTASRTYTIPDTGGNSSFVMSASTAGQTIAGGLTVNGGLTLGTPLAVSSGGIGVATLTAHTVLVGNGAGSIIQIGPGTAGQVLISGGSSSDPAYVTPTAGSGLSVTTNSTTLSYAISAPVSIANGGTNSTTALTNGNLMVSSAGKIIEGTSSTAPSFTTVTATTSMSTPQLGTTTLEFPYGGPFDTRLYRTAAGVLTLDNNAGGNATLALSTIVGSNVSNAVSINGSSFNSSGQLTIVTGVGILTSASTGIVTAFQSNITGDSGQRLQILTSGAVEWGPGSGGTDVMLQRTSIRVLQLSGGSGGSATFTTLPTVGSAMAVPASSTTAGTITQSGNTVTGAGTSFTATMVGGLFTTTSGLAPSLSGLITAVSSATSMTVDFSASISSSVSYIINYGGVQLSSAGNLGIQNLYMENTTASYIPAPLNYYEQASVSLTLTGPWATNPTATMRLVRIGCIVQMWITGVLLTGTAVSQITPTPASVIPLRFQPTSTSPLNPSFAISVVNTSAYGYGQFNFSGSSGPNDSFFISNAGTQNFTAAGTCGFPDIFISYTVVAF